jgi:hypothetical protein
MFQGVGSRTFLRPSNALKMTIPDLLRKCKRDTLPPSSVPRPMYFSSSVSLFPLSSWLEKKHSLPYKGIATNVFSWRYPSVKQMFTSYKPLEEKKTTTDRVLFPSDQLAPNTFLVLSSLYIMCHMTIRISSRF